MKTGDTVILECAGATVRGKLKMVSPNRKSLMVELEEGLRTPTGVYMNFLALLMDEVTKQYLDLLNGNAVIVRTENHS